MKENAEKALSEMTALRKRDLDPDTRERVANASRDLQETYLAEASPAAYERWRASRERAPR